MSTTSNQRPGVYSRYDISSAYLGPRSGKLAAVVAKAGGGEAGKLYMFTAPGALNEAFPPDGDGCALRGCVQILLESGVSGVLAVAVGEEGYAPALALLEDIESIGAVVCDCTAQADLASVAASVAKASAALRERVAYCGVADAAAALAAAPAINSERVVVCCPGVCAAGGGVNRAAYGAAAVAGRVLSQGDCCYNYSGEMLPAVAAPEKLAEGDVQALLAAGVTVLEQTGGNVEIVRALTTRTRDGGETDYSLRGLNAILCIDDVMQSVRAALKASLRGIRLSGGSLQTIQSQVVLVLAAKQDSGVLERFDTPKVYADESDPTVCIVELGFHIAQVVSQIHITAHIQV